jgi:hypothetical protein
MDEKLNRAETSIEIFQKMLTPSDEEVMGHIMLDTLADIYLAADQQRDQQAGIYNPVRGGGE